MANAAGWDMTSQSGLQSGVDWIRSKAGPDCLMVLAVRAGAAAELLGDVAISVHPAVTPASLGDLLLTCAPELRAVAEQQRQLAREKAERQRQRELKRGAM